MHIGGRQWLVISAIVGAFATSIIALQKPATSFEPSIYAVYPIWLRFLFGASLVGGVVSAFRGAFDSDRRRWLAATGLVFGLYIVLFFLPVFRQYALFGRGSFDTLAHVGYIKTIVDTGYWADSDWYPLIHIIGAIFKFFGIRQNVLVPVAQSVFFPIYVLSTFVYTRHHISERAGMFAGTATLPLVFGSFHATIQPFFLSFTLFPLALFAVHHRKRRWLTLASLLLIALVFFHPVTAAVTLGYIILSKAFVSRERPDISSPSFIIPMAGGIALATWYLGFARTQAAIANMFLAPTVAPPRRDGSVSLTLRHTIIRAIELYGDVALIAGMSFIAALVLTGYTIWAWRNGGKTTGHASVIMFIAVGLVLGVGLFAGPMSNPIRTGRYFLLFGAIGIGVVFTMVFDYPIQIRGLRAIAGLVAIVLVVATLIGSGGIYSNGNHLTEQEQSSVNWMLHYTESDPVLSLDMSHKMTLSQRGFHALPQMTRFQKYNPELQIPAHLGYPTQQHVAELHETPYYLYTKAYDSKFYQASYREQWDDLVWYSQSDLRRLQDDSTANHIYSTGLGNSSVWMVTSR